MSSKEPIYKLAPRGEWLAAEEDGRFDGSAVDRADGFIHFSTGAQVRETAARHFAGKPDLVIVAVDPGKLGDALRWEPSRGGALFPHLYGALPLGAVLSVEDLPVGPGGDHLFPGGVR